LYSVRLYQPSDFNDWNKFVDYAKNATFLFHRSFMEYHKDRFKDYSLMIFKKDKLIALLPANENNNEVYSHQGLTYGGFLVSQKTKLNEITEAFKLVLEFLNSKNILKLHLKLLPSFYATYPSEEIQQLLYILQAQLINKDLFGVIDLYSHLEIQNNRLEGVKKARKNNLIIKEEDQLDTFWNSILIPNLQDRYKTKPVHSLKEIQLLKNNFPNKIRQFNVYKDDVLIGGATVFETKQVAHIQYISANSDRQTYGTLDFLFYELIIKTFKHKKYFDFGTSGIPKTNTINSSLHYWKECFGARAFMQEAYTIDTKKSYYLDDFLS